MKLFDSAFVTVPGGLIVRGRGARRVRVSVRYGLIDRGADGLCLVDTGYGPAVTMGDGRSRMLRVYNAVLRPRLIDAHQPRSVLAAMGAKLADVRTIVLTHFHADHVANLADFPEARILASGVAAKTLAEMGPARALHHGVFKELIPATVWGRISAIEDFALKPTWTRLYNGHDLFGDGSYLAVPLPGHALGHFGLVWREAGNAVCYATDATWALEALQQDRTARLARAVVFQDRTAAVETENLLRAFIAEGNEVRLCHDIVPETA